MLKVNIQKLHKDAIVPKYAKEGDAGFDLTSITGGIILPGQRLLLKTGLAFEVPYGYELQIRPRSGLAIEHGISIVNSPGTVDSGYRGEVGVILINHGDEAILISKGDRIAQGVLNRYEEASFVEVKELSKSERGGTGFGSSGVASNGK